MITVSDGVYPGIIAALRSLVSAGGKVVLGTGVVFWSLFTLLTPIAAAGGMLALLATRVLMGTGEPLSNYDAVRAFLATATDRSWFVTAPRQNRSTLRRSRR